MIIQFRTSKKYIKLKESNLYKANQVRFSARSDVQTVYVELSAEKYKITFNDIN